MTHDVDGLSRHVMRLDQIDLVGGGRAVDFRVGLNLVRGDILTGEAV